ncbi:MAG: hypothetical protein AB1485_04580, partial [Candidatus Thermoplasmatota archaeon]
MLYITHYNKSNVYKFVIVMAVLCSIILSNITIGEGVPSRALTTWEAPLNLSNNIASSIHPRVACWENYVHVVWEDEEGGYSGIYYRRSTSSGVFWDAKWKLSSSYSAYSPAIAVWQNYVHAVWTESTGIYYRRSNDNGSAGSWSTSTIIVLSSYCSRARIAINQTEVYVVWHESYYIRLIKSTDNGTHWSTTPITLAYGYVENPDIACWNDAIYVVWQEKRDYGDEYWNIRCNLSLDKGANWAKRNITENTNTTSINPAIAANSNNAWVVWQDNRDNNWEIYWCNLTTFEQRKNVTTLGDSKNPAVAVHCTAIYVVWSDNTEGNFEIYLAISTNNGTTWSYERVTYTNICISDYPAIYVTNTIHIFWHDTIDKDFDIYYTRPEKEYYQVKLECEINSKEIDFNSSVNYTIIIKNLGNRVDTIELRWEFYQQPDTFNWSASLNLTNITLEPGGSGKANLTVSVKCPDITSKAWIRVIARSKSSVVAVEDSVETITSIIPIYNLSLECQYSRSIVEAGKTAYYSISIHNKGNRKDTIYLLDLIQVSVPFGWDSWLSDYELGVEPNEARNFYLCVRAPNATKGITEIKVRALSKCDSTKKDYATTYTGLGIENFTIDLSCEDSDKSGDPGTTINYTITVWNLAESGEISLELNTTLWNASLSKDKIYLATGAKTEIFLYLTVPENATAGERLAVNLTSKLENYTSHIILTARVSPIYNITAIYNKTSVIEAGKNETLNLSFKNNGNAEDLLRFKIVKCPERWSVNLSVESIPIAPNEIKYLEILLFTPRATPAGE